MRERDLNNEQTEMPGFAVIRRMRARRRLGIETAQSLMFNAAAYRLDRELGVAEHIAVENNLRIVSKWPDLIYEEEGP